MEPARIALTFLESIVLLLLVVSFVGAVWIAWCCAQAKARLAYLEAKLKALYEHYEIAMPYIIKCVDKTCPNTGGQDPDWPPPEVPKWP